jgi:DNA-directed RNA polymerase subunit RPC12/RpoP
LALSEELSPITEAQIKWGYRNCIEHIGRRTNKGVISCLECGHSWTDKAAKKHCTCPQCNIKLVVKDTKQRVFDDYQYLCIVTGCRGFQVLRFIYIDYRAKVGTKAQYFHSEVVQRWIAPDGKYATMSRLRPTGFFVHTWSFGSPLEIRPEKALYNIIPTCVYPHQKLIPEIKRSGYKNRFYGLTPFDLFQYILAENKAETLLKSKQTGLLKFFASNTSRTIADYWASIRICIRGSYKPADASLWCDYVDLLRFFCKDLHNARYVCPADLKAEHDKYVKKKKDYMERQRREKARKKALDDEAKFQEMKFRFFGIRFTDGLIQVQVLESVEEVMLEGDSLHHCVFTNEYHIKPDSLILSARINDQRLETVEFSLAKLQVRQSRGLCNENTKYHNRIIKLVEKNMPVIQKRLSA